MSVLKKTDLPPNVVNVRHSVVNGVNLLVRHYNHVGVYARIFTMLCDEGINIEEMQNTIFQTGTAACCSLSLDKRPTDDLIQQLEQDKDVLEVMF